MQYEDLGDWETLRDEFDACLYPLSDFMEIMDQREEDGSAARIGKLAFEHAQGRVTDLVKYVCGIIGEITVQRPHHKSVGDATETIIAVDFTPSTLLLNALKKGSMNPGLHIDIRRSGEKRAECKPSLADDVVAEVKQAE